MQSMRLKDAGKLASAGLKGKAQALLDVLAVDSFQNPRPMRTLGTRPL